MRTTRLSTLAAALLLSACLAKGHKLAPETPQSKARATLADAKKLHDAGNYEQAKPKLLEALSQDPTLGAAYTLLGREALAEGDLEEAKTRFTKARELDSSDAEAALGLGTTLTQAGDFPGAEKQLNDAKRLKPESSRVYYFLGECYAKQEKNSDAATAYREAIRLEPGYLWPKLGLARLLRIENPDEAKKLVEEAEALDPTLDEPHHLLGLLASDKSDYPTAEAEFREALAHNDKLPRNYMNLGTTLAYQGKLDEARSVVEKAIALDPQYTLAYNNLSHLLRQAGRNDDAIAAAQKAVSLSPNTPLYQVNLGDTLSGVGRFSEAAAAYRAALALAPNQASLARKLAVALSLGGDTPAAYQTLSVFLTQNPTDPAAPALIEERARLAKEELKAQLR